MCALLDIRYIGCEVSRWTAWHSEAQISVLLGVGRWSGEKRGEYVTPLVLELTQPGCVPDGLVCSQAGAAFLQSAVLRLRLLQVVRQSPYLSESHTIVSHDVALNRLS